MDRPADGGGPRSLLAAASHLHLSLSQVGPPAVDLPPIGMRSGGDSGRRVGKRPFPFVPSLRHSRESGSPVWGQPTHALGSRFRGNDEIISGRMSPTGRFAFPSFAIPRLIRDPAFDVRAEARSGGVGRDAVPFPQRCDERPATGGKRPIGPGHRLGVSASPRELYSLFSALFASLRELSSFLRPAASNHYRPQTCAARPGAAPRRMR
jgi:hypothetical protein